MYQAYTDNIPLKKISIAYSAIAANDTENDPRRQDALFLDGRTQVKPPLSRAWWQRVGWPVGALGSATMATTALLTNLVVMAWVLRTFKLERGVSEIFAGPCHKSARINTWLHLGINAVSTMLLSGSNYCMQIVSAPTRKEIDIAHAGRKWLDIGVPSVRNLKNVSRKKVVMWWLLGLSSVPLHLMYNSVFFSTIATNEYDVIFANEAFVEGGPNSSWNEVKFPGINYIQAQAKTWERLDRLACLNAYAVEFLNTRRHLVARPHLLVLDIQHIARPPFNSIRLSASQPAPTDLASPANTCEIRCPLVFSGPKYKAYQDQGSIPHSFQP